MPEIQPVAKAEDSHAADEPSRITWKGRSVRTTVWLAIVLLLLELVLQVIAYNVWIRQRSGELRSEGDGPIVLCVGDSLTHGLGATGEAGTYPDQLQRILRERDSRSWVVINCGWAGRDSGTVLKLLPDQLQRFRPDYVCVLVGINDQWTRGTEVSELDFDNSFPIVWRTGRFIDIMMAGRLDRYENAPFVGVWNMEGTEFRFEADGSLSSADQDSKWLLRDGELIVIMESDLEVVVDWEIKDDKLHLNSGMWNRELVLNPGPAKAASPVELGQRELLLGHLETAITAFQGVVADANASIADQALAREGLVTVCVTQNRAIAAEPHIDWLRAQLVGAKDTVDLAVGESLVHAYRQLGRPDDAVQTALRIVPTHPGSFRAWHALFSIECPTNPKPVLLRLIGEALSQLPPTDRYREILLVQRGVIVQRSDPVEFLRSMFEAVLIGTPESFVHNYLFVNRARLSESARDEALAGMKLSDEQRTRLVRLFNQSFSEESDSDSILASHLARILDVCRDTDAIPLLLDYPFREPNHLMLVDSIASSKGVDRIRVRPRFEALLKTVDRDKLFLPEDMHCINAGYEVMASVIATELLKR